MSDDERVFIITASKTITAKFEVYADDEEDARFDVENPAPMSFEVSVSDALSVEQDEWDVTDVEEKT